MKIDFLHTDPQNTRLILIFTGWSTGPEAGADISMDGWDVAVVHDFTELTLDTSFLDTYYTVYLFAWSLGVFASSRLLPAERITAAFAVNGTLDPVDDRFGIPEAIYDGTADGLDARNLRKFRLRMLPDRSLISMFDEPDAARIENLRHQLREIREASASPRQVDSLPWVRAYVSKGDRIFPPANQTEAWRRDAEVDIVELDEAHYVDLGSIVKMAISDPKKVSERFGKASVSYDTHAIAQYSAAIKLAGKFDALRPSDGITTLEIGCGTGLFTREYSRVVTPAEATFVDITEVGPFGIAPKETYVVEDAERWIERQQQTWDAILSASAIQWFADIPRFLRECHRCLNPGGIIAISTFVPGNMEELDALRPSPLLYPKAEQLREWLERDFEEVEVTEDEIRVEFRSVRDVLMHLKHTGVAGSAPSTGLTIKDMSHLRTLTYRPVYLLARKRPETDSDGQRNWRVAVS